MTSASSALAEVGDQPGSQVSWLVRWAPVGGLLFVLGFTAVYTSPVGDDTAESGAEFLSWADANSGWLNIGMGFVLLSLLLVPCFVFGLFAWLESLGARSESMLALLGGSIFSVLFFVGLTIWISPALYIAGYNDPALQARDADTALGIADLSWFVLGGAGIGAALMIFAVSIAILRTRVAPAWVAWLSVVLGIASLATVVLIGMFAWGAWIGVASIAMLVKLRP